MTISELCTELNNWFERDIKIGTFEIRGGTLDVDFLLDNQYFRVVGSTFNESVYKFGTDTLVDEMFSGEVWAMAVPPDVISLISDINDWLEKNAAAINSPYSSESFGGYSYSLAGQPDNGGGAVSSGVTWQAKFRTQLNKWRKV